MALIKLKRGSSANVTSVVLEYGEPAIDTNGKLWIGDDSGGKFLINPDGGSSDTASRLSVPRNFSASGDLTAPPVAFDGTQAVNLVMSLANSGVVAGTYLKVTVDAKGRVIDGELLTAEDIPALTTAKITDAGTASKRDVGTASGNVPVLGADGKLDASLLPSVAVTYTYVVDSQAEMLALDAEQGSVAIRTDISKSFILAERPASAFENWRELLTPEDTVHTVNGQTGDVVISSISGNAATASALAMARNINGIPFDGTADITIADGTKEPAIAGSTEEMYWNGLKAFVSFDESVRAATLIGLMTEGTAYEITYADTVLSALGKLQAQINEIHDAFAPLDSPGFSGVVTAPTVAAENNSAQVATTAFVHAQGYLSRDSIVDGGTF